MQGKVLVIEDDIQQARFIELLLTKNKPPFSVTSLDNAEAALKLLSSESFDVITLDYHLPSMTGLEALVRLKKQFPHIPVVMVTGQGGEDVARQALRQGAHDYITKTREHLSLLPRVLLRVIRENHLARQLEQSRKRYYDLFHNANIAIFVINMKNFQIAQLNKSAESLLGYSLEEGVKKTFNHMVVSEQRDKVESFIKTIVKSSNARIENLRLISKQKHIIPTDIHGSLVSSGAEQFIELFVTDVREKQRMHRQLLLSQQRLLSLVNGITDLICVIKPDYSLVMGNKTYLESTSHTPQTIIKSKCYEALFNRQEPCHNCPAKHTLLRGEAQFAEIFHDDSIYHISTFSMRNLQGKPDYIVEYVKDVTDQKDVERQLIKAEKLASIGLLASGIAHELRNPLNIIETTRFAIETELDHHSGEIDKKLQLIKSNIQRASSIIDNLLHFSRHSDFDREKVDIESVIKSTLSLLYSQITNQHIELFLTLSQKGKVLVNLDSLKQVFLNIILNAIQAMPDGGKLVVRSSIKEKEWIDIDFVDNGEGISNDNLKHLFTPFFSTKDPVSGTGLGLYLSYMLIKREKGDIFVKSTIGVGTTFTVRLPLLNE